MFLARKTKRWKALRLARELLVARPMAFRGWAT